MEPQYKYKLPLGVGTFKPEELALLNTNELMQELGAREVVPNQLGGWLYSGIIQDEIAELRKEIFRRNGVGG